MRAVNYLKIHYDPHRPLLVHCAEGVSRSASVVVLFLMETQSMTLDEALAFVKSKRPQVDINPVYLEML